VLANLAHTSKPQQQAWLEGIGVLQRGTAAIELSLAMVIARLRRCDPAELGYLTFAAFCRERLDWEPSWRRDLVRLVESPLDLIKQAACEGLVPLRLAVRAPGTVTPEGQAEWLEQAALGDLVGYREPRVLDVFQGEDADVIRKARRLGRLCLGRDATEREVDDYLIRCWRERIPAEAILATAHARPAAPPEEPELSWDWCRQWAQPASVAEALARMDEIQAILRGRSIVLSRALSWVVDDWLWLDHYDSLEDFAYEVLRVSARHVRRLAKVGRTLEWYPELETAVGEGLPPRCAEGLAQVLDGEPNAHAWLAVAARVGRLELMRALREARADVTDATLRTYEEAIDRADREPALRRSAGAPAEGPGGGQPVPGCGEPVPVTSAGALRVALPHDEARLQGGGLVRAPEELLPASRWWVENVRIAPLRGFSRVKERDAFRCQNPECGRMSLRNEAHHLVMRSEGGPDTDENGICLCRVCHLRGVHGGRLELETITVGGLPALLWSWPDGRRVVAFRERPVPVPKYLRRRAVAAPSPVVTPAPCDGAPARQC